MGYSRLLPFRWMAVGAILVAVAFGLQHALSQKRRDETLALRLTKIRSVAAAERIDCEGFRAQRPLVLLVLGQSNAGNHGEPPRSTGDEVAIQVMQKGVCGLSRSPLPGGTGDGGSVWTLLPGYLQQAGVQRPVVVQLLAVDATLIGDWTATSSPLRRLFEQTLSANKVSGLLPDLVLWQQGEADAQQQTSQEAYRQGLVTLGGVLRANDVHAPVIMAMSTVCRSSPYVPVRAAIDQLASTTGQYRMGPDTDALAAPVWRSDGCHWSLAGRHAAAQKWRDTLLPNLAK